MANIHDGLRGATIRTLATASRRYPADFPGWGTPGAAASLLPIPPGMTGLIRSVNSHGMAPYTRYSVLFPDGTHAADLILGADFIIEGTETP